MDNLITTCEDGTCCCIPARSSVVLISIVSLVLCVLDLMAENESYIYPCMLKDYLESMRSLLVTLFQMANMLLLLATMVENAFLVQIYIWYTMGFVILGFILTLIDFLFKFKYDAVWSFIGFVSEIVFLFVTFRCLPLVDMYRGRIEK